MNFVRMSMLGLSMLGWALGAVAEEVTITTYYPSPRGVYDGLMTNTFYHVGGSGDANNDGAVQNADRQLIGNWLNENDTLTPEQYAQADINGDGQVNSLDEELLRAIVFGEMTEAEAQSTGKRLADQALSPTLGGNLIVRNAMFVGGGSGDANNDGIVDNSDRARIVAWLTGAVTLTPEEYAQADISGDGQVNLFDQDLITEVVLGNITVNQARSTGRRLTDQLLSPTLDGNIMIKGGLYIRGGNGDANNDGTITVADPTRVSAYLQGTESLSDAEYTNADITGDGVVNRLDQEVIIGLLFNQNQRQDAKDVMSRLIQPSIDGRLQIEGPLLVRGGSGDVNGDGTITVADVQAITDYLGSGTLSDEEYARAEVTGDGFVNGLDQEIILDMVQNNVDRRREARTVVNRLIQPTLDGNLNINGRVGIDGEIQGETWGLFGGMYQLHEEGKPGDPRVQTCQTPNPFVTGSTPMERCRCPAGFTDQPLDKTHEESTEGDQPWDENHFCYK